MTTKRIYTAACVQHCATDDLDANIARLVGLIGEAVAAGADLICLPEACDYLSGKVGGMAEYAQPARSHVALGQLAKSASAHAVWLLVGSLTMRDDTGAVVNRSLVIDPLGRVVEFYDKIHMFDASVPGLKVSKESEIYLAGTRASTVDLPWGKLGLSICYDLRFPQLYRALAQNGASMLSVPAAFTRPTGQAHWHVLLRSRAIENGCFVFAAGQWGNHYGDRFSFGHSLIVDPWGVVLADAGDGDGLAIAEVDMNRVADCRAAISSLKHDREFELAHSAT